MIYNFLTYVVTAICFFALGFVLGRVSRNFNISFSNKSTTKINYGKDR